MQVVRGELVMPPELPGVAVDRDDRGGIEVVALPIVTEIAGRRIADAPVNQIRLGIETAGHPRGAAAARQLFLPGPRLAARLALARDRVEAPHALAGLGIVGVDEPARRDIAARITHNHLVFDHKRRGDDSVAHLVVVDHGVPHDLARVAIERQHVRVEGAHVHLVAERRKPSVGRVHAAIRQCRRQQPAIAPDLAAGPCIDRPGVVVVAGDVEDPVHHQRRPLEAAGHRHALGLERPLR